MANIVIYVGTFNPIHAGHIHFVKQASEILESKKSIIVPSGEASYKTCLNIASPKDRVEMCRLATKDLSGIEVSDFEASKTGFSYTYHTIEYFKSIYTEDDLYLLVGSDNFLSIDRWNGADRILSNVTLCTAVRKDGSAECVKDKCDMYKNKGYRSQILDIDTIDMSSTRLRSAITAKQDFSVMTSPHVKDYIISNNLYRQDEQESGDLSLNVHTISSVLAAS